MPTVTQCPVLYYELGWITVEEAARVIERTIRQERVLKLEASIREAERGIRTARDKPRLLRVQYKRL